MISGDLWAGAEAQALTLLQTLRKSPDVIVAAALMNEGELARRLRASDIPVTVFPETRLNALQILAGLRKLMREWRPDIVHTHRTKENVLGAVANRLACHVPSVRTVHGASEHPARGFRQLHKTLFAKLDRWSGLYLQQRIVAVSQELAGKLATEFPRDKIVVVENGIDADAARLQAHSADWRDGSPAIHVGIVGRLVPVKRVDLFLETAAALRRSDPRRPWRFHVIGDGPLHAALTARVGELGLTDVVKLHGHREDVISCIASLDVLINCSDHEGLPMTILEALAVGTPIVAHAVGGMVAALEASQGAALVHRHTADGYAAAVLDLSRTASTAERRPRLQERFTAAWNARSIYQLYLDLAGRT